MLPAPSLTASAGEHPGFPCCAVRLSSRRSLPSVPPAAGSSSRPPLPAAPRGVSPPAPALLSHVRQEFCLRLDRRPTPSLICVAAAGPRLAPQCPIDILSPGPSPVSLASLWTPCAQGVGWGRDRAWDPSEHCLLYPVWLAVGAVPCSGVLAVSRCPAPRSEGHRQSGSLRCSDASWLPSACRPPSGSVQVPSRCSARGAGSHTPSRSGSPASPSCPLRPPNASLSGELPSSHRLHAQLAEAGGEWPLLVGLHCAGPGAFPGEGEPQL